jgi:hypothetical protein
MGTLNLLSGESSSTGGNDRIRKRNVSPRISISFFIYGSLFSILSLVLA